MSASLFRRRRRSSKVRFTPPNPSEAQQWLSGAERFIGKIEGSTDKILFDEIPPAILLADFTIKENLAAEMITGDLYFWSAANSTLSPPSAFIGLAWLSSDKNLAIVTRSITGVFTLKTFGVWDGFGEVSTTVNGTVASCFVDGVQLGVNQTIGDITNFTEFPLTYLRLYSNYSNRDYLLWDVEVTGVPLIPVNEGFGTELHDINGVRRATIYDSPTVSFWNNKLLPDNLGNGAYGLHDLTQQVVPVAIADRPVGNFDGWDTIVSTQLPDSFLNGRILELEGEYRITAIDNVRILWNLTLSTDNIRITYDIYHNAVSGTLNYFYRGVDNVSRLASICNWDGVGNVRAEISPTILQVYVNGTASPPVTTDDISSANFDFDTIFVGGRGPAQNASIIGQHWDFKINGRLIPINETSGTGIFDSDGALFGTLIDAIPESFRSKGIATKYNLNRHGKVTTTGFAGDEWLTRAEIDALHNNTTRFTSDSGLSVLRSLPYDDINTLDAGQIAKINRYMGR